MSNIEAEAGTEVSLQLEKTILVAIATVTLAVPALLFQYLDLLALGVPLVLGFGLATIKYDALPWIPNWVGFDIVGLFVIAFGAWSGGDILPLWAVAGVLVAALGYDIVAVHFSETMEGLAAATFKIGYPAAILVPHSTRFDLDVFRRTVSEEGLRATIDDPRTAATLVGIGDFGFPAALAAAAASASASSVTVGLGIALEIPLGGVPVAVVTVAGLSALFVFEPPKLAALTVAVPAAFAGVGVSLWLGWLPVSAFLPSLFLGF